MNIELDQRGRSSVEFLSSLAGWGGEISQRTLDDAISLGLVKDDLLEDNYDDRAKQIYSALKDSKSFQTEALINEWLSINHGLIALDAFEEVKTRVEPKLLEKQHGPCELILDPNCKVPDYWENAEIHRTTGGWNGHEHMGFIHREIIHKRFVAAKYPWKIEQQRRQVLDELPAGHDYKNILEMGCGTGQFTSALLEKFPDSSVSACDLSKTLLEESQRIANENHWPIKLYQAPAEDTGLQANHFDLVTSYILLHELPRSSVKAVFKEALHLLKPGGVMMMCDVRPLWDMDKFSQWRTRHRADFGGEPFWAESTSLNLADLALNTGFEQVKSYGLTDTKYPWITIGIKSQ
ncbi:MAG: class I SAM-dependent methyltransferase [Acidiferrobacterales bacterium]|nr:class I SAM-dependent methyltransferase [Acidiferrobacterales bacterium]